MVNDNVKLLKVAQVANIFQVKPYTIRYWIKRYKIPAIMVGKRIYLTPDAVKAFLDKCTIQSGDDDPSAES